MVEIKYSDYTCKVVRDLYGKEFEGQECRVGDLSINKNGYWRDFSTGESGGVLDLLILNGVVSSRKEAHDYLEREENRPPSTSLVKSNKLKKDKFYLDPKGFWSSLSAATPSHPYALKKDIDTSHLRVTPDNKLVVPMFNQDGKLTSLELIDELGNKRKLKGANASGGRFVFDGLKPSIYCEGYATGNKIHKALGRRVVVCFDADNLVTVCKLDASKGDLVAADNDNGPKKDSNYIFGGLNRIGKGHKSATKTGLTWFIPPRSRTDFWDYSFDEIKKIFNNTPESERDVFSRWDIPSSPKDFSISSIKDLDDAVSKVESTSDIVAILYQCRKFIPVNISLIELRGVFESVSGVCGILTLDNLFDWLESDLNLEKNYLLSSIRVSPESKKRHNVIHASTWSPNLIKGEGVYLTDASTGSGKTQHFIKPFVESFENGEKVLVISPRQSLVKELTNRIEIDHYEGVDETLDTVKMGICTPSIITPKHSYFIDRVDIVCLDEISQIIDQITSESLCVKHAKRHHLENYAVYNTLIKIVRNARYVIGADAGLNEFTLKFLETARPGEKFNFIKIPEIKPGINVNVYYGNDAKAEALAKITECDYPWVACESQEFSEVLGTIFDASDLKSISIHGLNKDEYSQKEFLNNAEVVSKDYQLVIASPVISSGISVEHDEGHHFTDVICVCSGGALVPTDIIQMIRRVRYVKNVHIYMMPNRNNLFLTKEALSIGQKNAGLREGFEVRFEDVDEFDNELNVLKNNCKNLFAKGLLYCLEYLKWDVRLIDSSGSNQHEKIKETRDRIKLERNERLIAHSKSGARDIVLVEELKRKSELSSDEREVLSANAIMNVLGTIELSHDDIELWDDGRIISKIRNYAAFTDNIGHHDDRANNSVARKFSMARAKYCRMLFDGFDTSKGDWITPLTKLVIYYRAYSTRMEGAILGVLPKKMLSGYLTKNKRLKKKGEIFSPLPFPRPGTKGLDALVETVLDKMGLSIPQAKDRSNVWVLPSDIKAEVKSIIPSYREDENLSLHVNHLLSRKTDDSRGGQTRERRYAPLSESISVMNELLAVTSMKLVPLSEVEGGSIALSTEEDESPKQDKAKSCHADLDEVEEDFPEVDFDDRSPTVFESEVDNLSDRSKDEIRIIATVERSGGFMDVITLFAMAKKSGFDAETFTTLIDDLHNQGRLVVDMSGVAIPKMRDQ